MRDIKFRALTFQGEFAYGNYVTDGKKYHAIVYPDPECEDQMINMHVNGSTVGQFTGVTDKVGVDIYEGDILSNKMVNPKLVVVHSRKERFEGKAIKNMSHLYTNLSIGCGGMTIISNMHENPELLNGDK